MISFDQTVKQLEDLFYTRPGFHPDKEPRTTYRNPALHHRPTSVKAAAALKRSAL